MRSRLLWPLVLFACLTLSATYPIWLHPNNVVPGDVGDPLLNAWILAWDAHALLVQPGGLFDANIFFPIPNTLAFSEHLFSSAILLFPLSVLTRQPVLVYNLNLLLSFLSCAVGMYWLVLRWTRCRQAAFLAGAAFALAPYRLAAIAHLQLLTLQWLPLTVLALDGLLLAPGRRWLRWAVLFALFLTLQVLASWYLAVFSGLVISVYFLFRFFVSSPGSADALPQPKAKAFLRVVLALVPVAVCCLPLALPYLRTMPELLAARPPEMAASLSASPTDFLSASGATRIPGPLTEVFRRRPGFTQENALYPGLIIAVLALAGVIAGLGGCRSRVTLLSGWRWRILALAACIVTTLALTFAAPYSALVRLLPPAQVVRVPARWMIPAGFALAGLVGFGSAAVFRWLAAADPPRPDGNRTGLTWGIAAALVVCVMADSFSAPLPIADARLTPDQHLVYEHLGALRTSENNSQWGLIELPMYVAPDPEYPETKRLLASTAGWWGLVNGYSGLTPARQAGLAREVSGFPNAPSMQALRSLADQNVRYLLVHADQMQEPPVWEDRSRWLAEADPTLLPAGRWGPNYLFVINPYGARLARRPDAIQDEFWSALHPQAANVLFSSPVGDSIYLLATLETSVGVTTQLTLYWQADAPVQGDYTVFVHCLDPTGAILAQADSPPVSGHLPTSQWEAGTVVQDNHTLSSGSTFLVGLYDPRDGRRLKAVTPEGTALPDGAFRIVP